ncbi:hypothetical protein L7F22_024921 [Adiantum nelumboides]|nr:hypothetical protein [Adiantum nelumboides]
MMQGDAQMRVRFLVNRSSQKILYMEAGKEFVDMLFGFLQSPVATILSGLRKQADMEVGSARSMEPALGNMSNVYESLRRMSSSSLLVPKEGLLSPPCPSQLIDCTSNESPSKLLQFLPTTIAAEPPQAPQVLSVVYRCQNNSNHLRYVYWESGIDCKECAVSPINVIDGSTARPILTSAMSIIDSPPASFAAVAKEAAAAKSDAVHHEGGYVQRYLSVLLIIFVRALVETKHGRHIKTLRIDHGGEYTSHAFKDLCLSVGICHEFSITDHPQQNGHVERKNHTLFEAARAMLLKASLPDAYWEEATATACYIQNRISSTRNPTTTPYTLWHGHPPHLGHLHIFGSIAYPLVTQSLSKLSPRAQRTIFVGYSDRFGIKAYRLYIQDHHKFIFARSVVFDEEFILSGKSSPPVHTTFSSPPSSVHSSHQSSLAASPTHTPMQNSYPYGHNFEPPLSIEKLSFITHQPLHARRSHAQPISNSPTPPLAPIPSQLTPLRTPAATTSITPQTLSTPLSSLPLICRPRSPHSPTITSSPHQTPASSLRQSSFLFHGQSNMECALQTAHKSTTPSPLSPHRKPLPPLLPASPSPSPSFFRDSHVTSPSSPIPIDINKFESNNSTSTTSPPQHTSTLHSDQAASSSHGHTRSLHKIYEAANFYAVLTTEIILEHPQEPLEDALPLSVHDALASSKSKVWHAAILDELQALEAANTWELVPLPEHHNIVSYKWLLKKKYHPNGSVDRYKARLVARGFTQQEGVDYFDTYSPVLGMTAFWVLIALAAKFNLLLHHLDIKTAFLHGFLQELIFMLQPPHFEDPHHHDYVCKLNKPIYGLK